MNFGLTNVFAHVRSFSSWTEKPSMRTLLSGGGEDKPILASLHTLSHDEQALYSELRDNRIRKGVRLEQEYVRFSWLSKNLQKLRLEW